MLIHLCLLLINAIKVILQIKYSFLLLMVNSYSQQVYYLWSRRPSRRPGVGGLLVITLVLLLIISVWIIDIYFNLP